MSSRTHRDRLAASRLSEACRARGYSYKAFETPEENWRVELYPVRHQGRRTERVAPLATFLAEHLHRAYDQAAASLPSGPVGAPAGNQNAKGWPAKKAARAIELAGAFR